MSKRNPTYRFLRQHIRYYLVSGVITCTIPVMVLAADNTNRLKSTPADFEPALLAGNTNKVDISNFKYGNPVLPGEYNVDVYVNNQWFAKRRLMFKAADSQKTAVTCFTENNLLEYGVKKEVLMQKITTPANGCYRIEEWIDNAFYDFDTSRLRVDISIPQVALQQNAQGYIDPNVWDRGLNAGFLSYSGGAFKTFNHHTDDSNRNTANAFMGIFTGLNIAGWQLRHAGQWQWHDQAEDNKSKSHYEATSTYLQRAFPQQRGVLTIGDSFSNGEVFDSFGYRGIDFSSDDRMLPNSMTGYAPRIRGNAKTNAKVEIRQQGQLIYQTTVAPGSFEINDLYPTGYGGNIDVSIIEATGEVQTFSVPYSAVVQMLRPGMNHYAVTVGKFREHDIDISPWIGQFKYQHGINNYLTGYTGVQIAQNFRSALVGAGVATPIGAVAFDVTQSNADFKQQGSQSGQSYKLSYSKLISPTNTNLTLAAYRYSTENYYSLRDAVAIFDLEDKGYSGFSHRKQRSQFQITLNQGLPEGWGNFYLVGSWIDYWDKSEKSTHYQVGYNNRYDIFSYGISATKREIEYGLHDKKSDTEYMFSLSFPFSIGKQNFNTTSTITEHDRSISVSARANDRLNYGASITDRDHYNPTFTTNMNYRSNFATLGGAYSIADSYQQAMLSVSGNIVAHAGGLHFGPNQADTMILVYAPNAAGAKVINMPGLTVNKSGYAVIPYVTPYRLNDIVLDPQGMSTAVELEQSSQRIAPYAGAIAKVDFTTKTGYAIYIKAKTADAQALPFTAQVYDQNNEVVGFVAQGSLIYLRTTKTKDVLSVRWGSNNENQCQFEYDVTNRVQLEKQTTIMTEATCK